MGNCCRAHDIGWEARVQRALAATSVPVPDIVAFDGDDNLLHVVVYGRITGAEIAVHTIALDGHVDEQAQSDPAPPCDVVHSDEPPRRR